MKELSGNDLRSLMPRDEWLIVMRQRRLKRLEIQAAKDAERQAKHEAVAQRKLEREWERRRKKAARLALYGDHSAPEEKWEPPDNNR